jgi:hypothetical protein
MSRMLKPCRSAGGAVRSLNLAIKKQSWKSRERKGTWSNKELVNLTFHRHLDISPVIWTLPPSIGHFTRQLTILLVNLTFHRHLDISPVIWTFHSSIGHFTRQLDIPPVNWTFHSSTGHPTRQLAILLVNWTSHPSIGHFTRQLDVPSTQSVAFLNCRS